MIIMVVVWFRKAKRHGEKIPLKAKIFLVLIILSGPSVIAIIFSPSPSPISEDLSPATFYVAPDIANVRSCQSTSCDVVAKLYKNEPIEFTNYNSLEDMPEWVAVSGIINGEPYSGYMSKTVLSENSISTSPPPSAGESSSIGGITIGPWNNIQTTVGESYEFHFCQPDTAISGATCGGLADTATNPKGGTPPYSFVKKSGFLPPGMTLELNGTLSGSPTEAGTYNFRMCAKDLYGGEGCQNLTVVVKKPGTSPITPASPPTPSSELEGTYSALLTFTADAPDGYGGNRHISGRVVFDPQPAAPIGGLQFKGEGTYEYSTTGCGGPNCSPIYAGNCWNSSNGSTESAGNITIKSDSVILLAGLGVGAINDSRKGQSGGGFCHLSPDHLMGCASEIIRPIIGGDYGSEYNAAGETMQINNSDGTYWCKNLTVTGTFTLTKK